MKPIIKRGDNIWLVIYGPMEAEFDKWADAV